MSLELFRGGPYKYRVSATNPRLIERKPTTRGGRWQEFRLLETEELARKALLRLNRPKENVRSENLF